MAGLYAPLPTLRRHPRGGLRTAWGRCGLLLLHRSGLAPPTPCRSPGAPTETSLVSVAKLGLLSSRHADFQQKWGLARARSSADCAYRRRISDVSERRVTPRDQYSGSGIIAMSGR